MSSPKWLSSRYFTLVLITLALPFICLAGRPMFGDGWWMLATGRELVNQGQLPLADPLTYAPHISTYFDAQWLAQLIYYGAYQRLGLDGVSLLNATVVTLTFGILLRVAWERSRNQVAAAIAVLLAEFTAIWVMHPRAQTLAFAAFAATAWLLHRSRVLAPTVVAVGVVQALWVNMHGSFFLGPLLTLILLTGELLEARSRAVLRSSHVQLLLAALVAQAAGTLLNPYGPSIISYLLKFSIDPIIREHISEWMPTTATDVLGLLFFGSAAITFGVVALVRTRVAVADLLILGVFWVLGLQAYRNIPWWGLATAPVLATYLARLQLPVGLARIGSCLITSRRQLRGNVIRGVLVAGVLIASLPWMRVANPWLADDQRQMVASDYPVAAANFLESQSYGSHMFSDHLWSAYLDLRLFPRYQQLMDSSIEVHPANVWTDILTLNQGHASWEELADTFGIDVMLLRPDTQQLLIEAVAKSRRWTAVYTDDQSVIYVRA